MTDPRIARLDSDMLRDCNGSLQVAEGSNQQGHHEDKDDRTEKTKKS